MRKAFTMIELIFVVVIIGILASIAIPRFAATRDDAVISRARATVGALRSAIATERQKRVLKGKFTNITGAEAEKLLEGGLSKDWSLSGDVFTFNGPNNKTCKFKIDKNKLEKQSGCNVAGMEDL